MELIEEAFFGSVKCMFYKGIDLEYLSKYPSDGSSGMIFCFVDNYLSEVKAYERNSKIKNILHNKEIIDSTSIEKIIRLNNCIAIYQTDGETLTVYNSVRKKLNIEQPWIPVSGILGGFVK
jgi:hypothetical protein